jgi:hypothetical protein
MDDAKEDSLADLKDREMVVYDALGEHVTGARNLVAHALKAYVWGERKYPIPLLQSIFDRLQVLPKDVRQDIQSASLLSLDEGIRFVLAMLDGLGQENRLGDRVVTYRIVAEVREAKSMRVVAEVDVNREDSTRSLSKSYSSWLNRYVDSALRARGKR